jgi:hypothetical protein
LSTPIDETDFDPDANYTEPVDFLHAITGTLDEIEKYSEFAFTGKRWPRLRQGERVRITGLKRRLIFERDGAACRNCGKHLLYREVEIDHIVPWSARGSDWSCNLRVLCEPCNGDRSNFRSGLDHDRRPFVATECVNCSPYEPDDEMLHAYCGRCGLVGPTWPELVM